MKKASKQFMKDLGELAEKTSRFGINPDDDEEYIINDLVAVEMVPVTDHWVHFISIRALDPGKGSGSKAMASVISLVDKRRINLIGKIIPYDTKVVSKKKLRAWYSKFGCKPVNSKNPDGIWIRVANPEKMNEIKSIDKKIFSKIDKGLSDFDANQHAITKGNLLLLGLTGFLLWMSTK